MFDGGIRNLYGILILRLSIHLYTNLTSQDF